MKLKFDNETKSIYIFINDKWITYKAYKRISKLKKILK